MTGSAAGWGPIGDVVPPAGVYPSGIGVDPPDAGMTSYEDTVAEAAAAVAAAGDTTPPDVILG